MMKFLLGSLPDYIKHPGKKFDLEYEPEWIMDPFVIEMIEDIDKGAKVISGRIIESPVLGPISPRDLASGIKNLIMIKYYKPNKTWLSTKFGDNCIPWLCKLSYEVDFELYPRHCLALMDYEHLELNAQGMDGEPLKTCREVWDYYMSNQANICEM